MLEFVVVVEVAVGFEIAVPHNLYKGLMELFAAFEKHKGCR